MTITDKLKSQTYYLDNLASMRSSNHCYFYAQNYFFKVHFQNQTFKSVDVFSVQEWQAVMLKQDRHGGLDAYLKPISELPFSLQTFSEKVNRVLDLFNQAKIEACLLNISNAFGNFRFVYLPKISWMRLAPKGSSLPSRYIPYLGYYTYPAFTEPFKSSKVISMVLAAILKNQNVTLSPVQEADTFCLKTINQSLNTFFKKGLTFKNKSIYEYVAPDGHTRFFCTNENGQPYLITKTPNSNSTKVERFPKSYTYLIWLKLLEDTQNIVEINDNKLLELTTSNYRIESFLNQKIEQMAFGKFYDSYQLYDSGEIWHQYGQVPEDFEKHSPLIDGCDLFFKMVLK